MFRTAAGGFLQPRRHHFRRLPREVARRDAVPHLGHATAAEIIVNRADSAKPHMGLTNWRGAKVRKEDVAIAKNYLNEDELAALNNLVEQYLVFATGQAMRRIPMKMEDWISKLNGFLTINDRDILTHAGRISHELAQGSCGAAVRNLPAEAPHGGGCPAG